MSATAIDYQKRVCRAMNYISQNADRELALDEVAEVAAFSRFHFHRIFKAVVGETVADFTRRVRLEMAANRLISDPQKDITTVAMECGYSSSQNFAKIFRQHFDMSPSQFRGSTAGTKYRQDVGAKNFDLTRALKAASGTGKVAVDAEVKQLPQRRVAYVRKMGLYNVENFDLAFGELAQWAEPRGYLSTGLALSICWDNPDVTPPEKCRLDACVTVPQDISPGGPVAVQTLQGGLYGVCRFEIPLDGFQQAWEDAFKWVIGSGYECADLPPYEAYLNDPNEHPEGKWRFEICIPLKAVN